MARLPLSALTPEQREAYYAQVGGNRDLEIAGAILAANSPKPKKKPKQPRGMTKTERSYQDLLEGLVAMGEIRRFLYEPVRLILGPRLTYAPDFAVLVSDDFPIRMVEVKPRRSNGKAFWTEDSRVKIKTAAQLYSGFFSFVAVWPDGRGGWHEETITPRATT